MDILTPPLTPSPEPVEIDENDILIPLADQRQAVIQVEAIPQPPARDQNDSDNDDFFPDMVVPLFVLHGVIPEPEPAQQVRQARFIACESIEEAITKASEREFVRLWKLDGHIVLNTSKSNLILKLVIKHKRIHMLNYMLLQGVNLIKVNNLDGTALHEACTQDDVRLVEAIVKANANLINVRDHLGNIPLHYAAFYCDKVVCLVLFEAGSNVEALNNDLMPPIAFAQNWNVFVMLCKMGCKIYCRIGTKADSLLHMAVKRDYYDIINYILSEDGAQLEARNQYGETPLHYAAKYGRVNGFQFLHRVGASLTATNGDDDTPLHIACRMGQTNVVRYILRFKNILNLECKNNGQGKNALHRAALNGKHRHVLKLLKSGVHINSRDNYDNTPLHCAVTGNHYRISKILIKAGADKDAIENTHGWTCLHQATMLGHVRIIELLITRGAKLTIKDKQGNIPLNYADELFQEDNKVIVHLMEDYMGHDLFN